MKKLILAIALAAAAATAAQLWHTVKYGVATSAAPYAWTNNTGRPLTLAQLSVTAVTPGEGTYAIAKVKYAGVTYDLPAVGGEAFTNGYIAPSFAPIPESGIFYLYSTTADGVSFIAYFREEK